MRAFIVLLAVLLLATQAFSAPEPIYTRCTDCVAAGNKWCSSALGTAQRNGCWTSTETITSVGCTGTTNDQSDEWADELVDCFPGGVGCETEYCADCADSDHVAAGCVWCYQGGVQRCMLRPTEDQCGKYLNGTCATPCEDRTECGQCTSSFTGKACAWCAEAGICTDASNSTCSNAPSTCPGYVRSDAPSLTPLVWGAAVLALVGSGFSLFYNR